MTTPTYVYRIAEVDRVIDGDSYRLRCDVGFYLNTLITVRLSGWDCPELHAQSESERVEAVAARDVVIGWMHAHTGTLFIRTEKDPDSFGRWLGDIWADLDDGSTVHLGEVLGRLQLATPWPTRWRQVYGNSTDSPTTPQ